MSCNGCRVLRKGCSDNCILRPCLQWIDTPEAQGHATVFVAKFFGRAGLMSFISSVPLNQRSSLFQSLLFEAAGRTVNPVNGAVGLLWSGNWHVCQASVETVLRGGTLQPMPELIEGFPISPKLGVTQEAVTPTRTNAVKRQKVCDTHENMFDLNQGSPSMMSDESSVTTTCLDAGLRENNINNNYNNGGCYYNQEGREVQLLNLFK